MNRRQAIALIGLSPVANVIRAQGLNSATSNLEAALSQDLWTDRDAYDACHYLMVPMYAAFRTAEQAQNVDLFEAFMDRFAVAWREGSFRVSNELNRVQFLLLVSRYLQFAPDNENLIEILVNEHRRSFLETPYPHWTQGEFPSLRDSIEWKLSTTDAEKSFHTAIVDIDLLTMTLAADIYTIMGSASPEHVVEARSLGLGYLRSHSNWGDNGEWSLGNGEFWDHPDNAYAGHTEVSENMEQKFVENLPTDTSHAHRLPVILDAFLASTKESDSHQDLQAMRKGLGEQIVQHCLVWPDEQFHSMRMTNYINGYNGLYRWNYKTAGQGNGYRPFELSGTFLLGWWSLLDNPVIRDAYQLTLDALPFTEREIATYVGPNTTRERNPLFRWPDAFHEGGFMMTCLESAVLL